jgi:hypothetical protein
MEGLTRCDTNYTDFRIHGRAHFAVAIVSNPWACLGEGIMPPTSVAYFDSMLSDTPLATSDLFAQAIVEWDAIRQGKGVGEAVNLALVQAAKSRIKFVLVKVSQPLALNRVCHAKGGLFRFPSKRSDPSLVVFM